MPDVWVCNASPIILLGKIERLGLLTSFGTRIVIPRAVIAEVASGHGASPIADFLRSPDIEKIDPPLQIESKIAGWDLGIGESEVLTWAIRNGNAEAILDDMSARKCARSLNIPVRGTVGIILLAKQRGIIREASPLVEGLLKAGLHFDRKWVSDALALVDEKLNT